MADERGSRNSNNSRGRSYGNSRGNSGSRGRGNGGGFHRGGNSGSRFNSHNRNDRATAMKVTVSSVGMGNGRYSRDRPSRFP